MCSYWVLIILAFLAVFTFVKPLPVREFCSEFVPNLDKYYCIEEGIRCSQCRSNTFLKEKCKDPRTDTVCLPCPPGTHNKKPYHLDSHCVDSPTIDKTTSPSGPVIGPPEETKQTQNWQSTSVKDVTSQPSNNQGRIPTMHLLTYLTLLLFFYFFT